MPSTGQFGSKEERQREARTLQRIRDQLRAIEPGEWMMSADDAGTAIDARGPMGELWKVARFDDGATPDEIQIAANAPAYITFLLGLVDRAIERLRPAGAQTPPAAGADRRDDGSKDYAAEAAMKCAEPAFAVFLEECHGLERPLTKDRVAQRLRGLLRVTSRGDLNRDPAAAYRWKRLRSDFDGWRKAGR